MSRIVDSILMEFEQEAATTRNVLERVPGNRLGWKPHEKSMSLGQLALHVANTPGEVGALALLDEVEIPEFGEIPTVESTQALMAAYGESLKKGREVLDSLDDARATSMWKAMKNGQELMTVPRIAFLRSVMLNHWYHHRGQLSVYLRLLDVPVPSIYGPSADENPFA